MIGIVIVAGITLISITGILAGALGMPVIRESINLKRIKLEEETKKLQYQKEILELELKKEELQIKRLEAESKQYDRLINE
ncbi:MAG: hypothetical protein LBJ41_11095 [Treponema sp.]|jgi:hypothetical protein|nr:hypothetical protein [Treponema sp.]